MAAGKAVTITPSANFTSAAADLGRTQHAVAANLQSLFDGGASMDAGFSALSKLATPAAYAKSLNALSGQTLGAINAFRFNASRAFIGNLYSGCASYDDQGNKVDAEHCSWARGFNANTTQDQSADALGYVARATGFQLGGQVQVGNDWYISGALAYESSKFRDDDRTATVKGKGALAGVGLRYLSGPLEVSGALDAGYGWYRSDRTINAGGASDHAVSRPNEWAVGAHLRAAYTFDIGRAIYAKPYSELHVMHVHARGFTESGPSPFNLDVAANGHTAATAGAGLEFGGTIPIDRAGTRLRPFASAGIQFGSNTNWETSARFAAQPTSARFTSITGAPKTFGSFAVGLQLLGSKKVDLSIQYDAEVAHGYSSQSEVAKLTYRF